MGTRETFVAKMVDGEFRLIPAHEHVWENNRPNTGVITDTMDNLWHPATGKHCNSKSTFRRMTRESGCEETGGERIKPVDRTAEMRQSVKEDLIRAYNDVDQRLRRGKWG